MSSLASRKESDTGTMSMQPTLSSRALVVWRFITTSEFLFFATLFFSFLCMGLVLAVTGPSLLELGAQTGASMDSLVYIFATRSIGFFLGTIVGGDLVDRFKLHGKTLLFVSLSSSLLFTFLVPLVPHLWLLLLLCLSQGIALGIVDNAAQVLLLRLMDDESQPNKVQPYMQALHAAFGVGGLLAPLILAPFLGTVPLIDPTLDMDIGLPAPSGPSNGNGTALVPDDSVVRASGSTDYQYGYFIVCLLLLPVCVALARYMLRDELSWQDIKSFARSRWAALLQRLRGRRGTGARWATVQAGEADGADAHGGIGTDQQLEHSSFADERNPFEDPTLAPISTAVADGQVSDVGVEMATARDDAHAMLQPVGDDSVGAPEQSNAFAEHDNHSHFSVTVAPPMAAPMHLSLPPQHDPNLADSNPSASPVDSSHGDALPSPLPSVDLPPSASPSAVAASAAPESSGAIIGPGRIDWKMWRLVLLISLFLFLYVGCETGYAAYIFSYGVQMLHMDPPHAAYLTSVFWFSFALGRVLGIPVSLRYSAARMIVADLLGCILSVLAMIVFHDSAALLWVGTVCYGVSVASIYPSAINYAESHFAVTGKVLSVLAVAASLGDALVPLLMGLSFASPTGPLGLMLIAAGVAVGAALIFAVTVAVAPRGRRYASSDDAERKVKRKKKKHTGAGAAADRVDDEPSDVQLHSLHLSQDEEAALELGDVRSDDYSPSGSRRSAYSVVQTAAAAADEEEVAWHDGRGL